MSPAALELAIEAVEARLAPARAAAAAAEANLEEADGLYGRARANAEKARQSLQDVQEALSYLYYLESRDTAHQDPFRPMPADSDDGFELEDVPEGAEAAGDGIRVWQTTGADGTPLTYGGLGAQGPQRVDESMPPALDLDDEQ